MTKKLTSVLLALLLVLSLAACAGGSKPSTEQSDKPSTKPVSEPSKEASNTQKQTDSIQGDPKSDLDSVQTIGELLEMKNCTMGAMGDTFVLAFEQGRMTYRAVAEMPSDVSEAFYALDWDDPERDEKQKALVSSLKVIEITNLTEGIPSQEELDQLVGKTCAELLDDGWSYMGWSKVNSDVPNFYLSKGPYSFKLDVDGETGDLNEFDEEDFRALTVKSVTFDNIFDPTYIEFE